MDVILVRFKNLLGKGEISLYLNISYSGEIHIMKHPVQSQISAKILKQV